MSLSRQKGRAGENPGFTLIELLVVVLIIGILASIAIPQYFKVVEKGKLVEAKSIIATLRSSEQRYFNANGGFIVAVGGLGALDIQLSGTSPKYGMKYFDLASIVALTACEGLAISVTRTGTVPKRYGNYTVTYDDCKGEFNYGGCTNCKTDFK